jgi:predicted lipid-binding transport protein (Tim44 family)
MPGGPHRLGWAETAGYDPSRVRASRAHTRYMGRIIGTILGAILAIWLAVTAAGGIFATFKVFLIIGLIALVVFVIVWLVAGRPRRD